GYVSGFSCACAGSAAIARETTTESVRIAGRMTFTAIIRQRPNAVDLSSTATAVRRWSAGLCPAPNEPRPRSKQVQARGLRSALHAVERTMQVVPIRRSVNGIGQRAQRRVMASRRELRGHPTTKATHMALVPHDPRFEARVRDSFAKQTFMATLGATLS